jgi:hypothetical protein
MYVYHENSDSFTKISPLTFANGASDVSLSQRLEIPQITMVNRVNNVSMVTKVARGFHTQSLPCTETCVDLHVKCLLYDFSQNWDV